MGAFLGLALYGLTRRARPAAPAEMQDAGLRKKDLPWLAAATLFGGILAPISLMYGLSRTSGFAASLLLNLEGVATALIAVLFFRENAPGGLFSA